MRQNRRMIYDFYRPNADILILQETHCDKSNEHIWKSQWGGEIIFSNGESNSRGIAVLVSKELYTSIDNIYKDTEGRLIIFDIKQNDTKVSIAAIYAPNKDTPSFFNGVQQLLRNRSEHKIVVGDFNFTLDCDLDRNNTYCNNNKSRDKVEDVMDEFNLREVWRQQNPLQREFSWFKRGDILKASRIDFALVSAGLDQQVKMCMYLNGIKTDHRAFYMVLDTSNFERGRGFWKFNTLLLKDKEFVDQMNEEIKKTLLSLQEKSAKSRWECLKARIKKSSINYSKKRATERALVISELSEKVNDFESRLPLPQNEDKLLEASRLELEEKLMERTKGLIFRSKVRWIEEGERNTKYFFSLEKARYNAKTCFKILDEQTGDPIENPSGILDLQRNFYTELYSEDSEVKF